MKYGFAFLTACILAGGLWGQDETDPLGINARWNNGLELKTNDGNTSLKLGGRIMLDHAWFSDDTGSADGTEFRRTRLMLSGKVNQFEWKTQYEFARGGEGSGDKGNRPAFKDVYVGVSAVPYAGALRVGHFKEPFGLEELTSSKYITFMERSLPTVAFAPGRSTGVGFQNTAFDERMTWAIGGFFSNTPDGASYLGNKSDYQVTGRVTGLPLYADGGRRLLHLGLAYSHAFKGSNAEEVVEVEDCTTNPNTGGETCTVDRETENFPYPQVDFDTRPEAHLAGEIVNTGDEPGKGVAKLGVELALLCLRHCVGGNPTALATMLRSIHHPLFAWLKKLVGQS